MFADLIRRLTAPHEGGMLSREDARVALAALMVRISRSDGSYSDVERRRIEAALAVQYRLAPAETLRIREQAERAEAAAQDTVQFTRLVKAAVPYEERTGVVEALWRVAAADGINAEEHGIMRLVASLLGVADQDSALARQRALRGEV